MTESTRDERLLITRLRALLELLPPALDRAVAEAGVTSFEYALLETVAESPNQRLRLSRLADSTNATLPRLSRVMDGLERKGLVERVPDDEGMRATMAQLTPAGRDTLLSTQPIMDGAVRRVVVDPLRAMPQGNDALISMSEELGAILRALDPEGRLAITSAAPFACTDSPRD